MIYRYQDRYRSGAILLANVTGWRSDGEAYYLKYTIFTQSGEKHVLDLGEFLCFEKSYAEFLSAQASKEATSA